MKRLIIVLTTALFLISGCSLTTPNFDVNNNMTYTGVTIKKLKESAGKGSYDEVTFSNSSVSYVIDYELYEDLESIINISKKVDKEVKFNIIVSKDDELLAISLYDNKVDSK